MAFNAIEPTKLRDNLVLTGAGIVVVGTVVVGYAIYEIYFGHE